MQGGGSNGKITLMAIKDRLISSQMSASCHLPVTNLNKYARSMIVSGRSPTHDCNVRRTILLFKHVHNLICNVNLQHANGGDDAMKT